MAVDPSEVSKQVLRQERRPHDLHPIERAPTVARKRTLVVKRFFDVAASCAAVILLSPMFAIIAVAIKIDSRGPVLFRQIRVGLRSKPFVIFKFRTMAPDADRIAPNVSPSSDPRITRVGRFLRSSYLDELPQLFNVIMGTMSVVGPRPETPEFVALYTPEERCVLDVKPGLLGPSTLASMDESAILDAADDPFTYYVDVLMHERVRLDLAYLVEMSLATDVRLLVRQVTKIIVGRA
jgi:lipopolysaccharide/colanic/teichoic acid biosynthesis glycosyltransferase